VPRSGYRFHSRSWCSGMVAPSAIPTYHAEALGYTRCSRCAILRFGSSNCLHPSGVGPCRRPRQQIRRELSCQLERVLELAVTAEGPVERAANVRFSLIKHVCRGTAISKSLFKTRRSESPSYPPFSQRQGCSTRTGTTSRFLFREEQGLFRCCLQPP
jgi:hypothetical protein